MQGWMIALIVVACVVAVLAIIVFSGAFIGAKAVLGRRDTVPAENIHKKFAVDASWFDEVKDNTSVISITSYDGLTLRALLIKHGDAPSACVAVCQHGYIASPRHMQPFAKIFYDKGYDVLLPAARAHDISDGKYIGMAWLDRFDILRWLDKTVALYGDKVEIALMGQSMGGSAAIAAAGMNPPPQVKCVIDDCGFSSQRDEYFNCVKKVPLTKRVASFPIILGTRLKCGYSVSDADIVPFAQKMTVPALFFHGSADTFVPPELGKRLFDACGSADKKFVMIDGAVHAAAYSNDKAKYTEELVGFVDKYISSAIAGVPDSVAQAEPTASAEESTETEQATAPAEKPTETEQATAPENADAQA